MKSFILSSVVWLFSFWACPPPMPLFTTSETVDCCLSFMPRFPRLAGVWMLGIWIGPVLEEILPTATTCWRVIVLEISIPKLWPYSWIPEGRWGFQSVWFHFFCIFLFQFSGFCLSYSFTVIWIASSWLLFVFCYNCPTTFCWIRDLN